MSYLTLLGGLGGKKQAFLNLPEAPAVSGPSNQEPHNRPPQSGCYEVPDQSGASGSLDRPIRRWSRVVVEVTWQSQGPRWRWIGTPYQGQSVSLGSEVEVVGTPYQGQSVSPRSEVEVVGTPYQGQSVSLGSEVEMVGTPYQGQSVSPGSEVEVVGTPYQGQSVSPGSEVSRAIMLSEAGIKCVEGRINGLHSSSLHLIYE
ncbi:unnamed protein product [Arctogadus glacialis]